MRLFLVARHGQSLFNVDQVVNGDPALDRGLSEQGIEEAERLAGQLAALPLDLVAVSPFPRALQTANIALAGREVPASRRRGARRRTDRRARGQVARRLPRCAGALEPEGALPRRREPRRGRAALRGRVRTAARARRARDARRLPRDPRPLPRERRRRQRRAQRAAQVRRERHSLPLRRDVAEPRGRAHPCSSRGSVAS